MAIEGAVPADTCVSPAEAAWRDLSAMRSALALAARGLGAVWPNPSVGCVILADGIVVGRGATGPGGRPHAETEALARAGPRARGATAYVGLEPCCHWGETPPCADALIAAGLARIVVACEDPDKRVAGGGLARLRAAGIAVESGLCAPEARELNAGFFSRVRLGRPLVTLKLATTLDGRIATRAGESRWITSTRARERAHSLRAQHDAIMIGTRTVLADDPLLNCRLPGLAERSPVRIVIDGHLRIPLTARLIAEARRAATWVVTLPSADADRRVAFEGSGARLIEVAPDADGNIDLAEALAALGARGLTRILVEGGARLAAGLLRRDLVDRLAWFHAPLLIGGDGIAAVSGLGLDALADAPRFERIAGEPAGEDVLTSFRRVP